jgi:hypothetical protein
MIVCIPLIAEEREMSIAQLPPFERGFIAGFKLALFGNYTTFFPFPPYLPFLILTPLHHKKEFMP